MKSAGADSILYYLADVAQAKGYYPFGMVMPGRSWGTESYRFGQNGQEITPELHDNHYTALYWEYDSRIGLRWNRDPKFQSFPWQSPYAVFSGNPIWFVDVPGDSAFRFNSKGHFIGLIDDGKSSWSIQRVISTKTVEDKLIVTYNIYQFNDPAKDVSDMKTIVSEYPSGSKVPLLNYRSKFDLQNYMNLSGVNTPEAQESPWSYAANNSTAGNKMDYWNFYLLREMLSDGISPDFVKADQGAFYIFEGTGGTAFNSMDAGNYLWGAGMQQLGFSLTTAKAAAHAHHTFTGRLRLGQGGLFDASADQKAIEMGYENSLNITSEDEK